MRAGESVIDLAEYGVTGTGANKVVYCQLKHSSTRATKNFTYSDFKTTLKGFAERYIGHFVDRRSSQEIECVSFLLVTNRPVSRRLTRAVEALGAGEETPLRSKIEDLTDLNGRHLMQFCSALKFSEREGDYIAQRYQLQNEMSGYVVGDIDRRELDGVVGLVASRALPKSEENKHCKEICREDVLQRLGVTSIRKLFPASPHLEELSNPIRREQHAELLEAIVNHPNPTIIHAPGGVGKSVVARQIIENLPTGSVGILYDCFGGGKYRNPSEPRHRACDALVQIANELAIKGLCQVLITRERGLTDDLFRAYERRLAEAACTLKKLSESAEVIVVIDAADNAELAAAEYGQECFAHQLLRCKLPEGCRLVFLCRTERIGLLKPPSTIAKIALRQFSLQETVSHLRSFYPRSSEDDASEFHRLTNGNPRVQASALSGSHGNVSELLRLLGPAGSTIEDQISAQLDAAVSKLRDSNPDTIQKQIDAICMGLANLPPFIPLGILAEAASVTEAAIKSFVSDLGRPLWLSSDAVRFRDEPTETWFQSKFGADREQLERYIASLEPLAARFSYAAKSLPQLYYRADDLEKLLSLALSDDYLPDDNPIDARNIRLYRLQFAFKAALRLKHFGDACRLAFRAGEEVAGDVRQYELLADNVELIPSFHSPHRIQELAYGGKLTSSWRGSDNIFSAVLLSAVDAFKGESRSYLRGAEKWLDLYFRRIDERDDDQLPDDDLKDTDVVQFAWTYLNLFGGEKTVEFLERCSPGEYLFRVTRLLVRRLIDVCRFDEVNEISQIGADNVYLVLAVADELMSVGRFPPKTATKSALRRLHNGHAIEIIGEYGHDDLSTPAILSLCEAAAAQELSKQKIKSVLRRYTIKFADRTVADAYSPGRRRTFLRGVALRSGLGGGEEPSISKLLQPEEGSESRRKEQEDETKELREGISALLPWYFVRVRLLLGSLVDANFVLEETKKRSDRALFGRYKTNDHLPYEISAVRFEVLALHTKASPDVLIEFIEGSVLPAERKYALGDLLTATRTAFRLPHLEHLCEGLESTCRSIIGGDWHSRPEERARDFIALARAVLSQSEADASAYFDSAVDAVSKFGDELVARWEAVCQVATTVSATGADDSELAYRFLRCAEMVGQSVEREKYWDRDEALRIAVNLHPPSAFAALSRWRDRKVGWFEKQLCALISEAVDKKIISSRSGWGFSGFKGCSKDSGFSVCCLSNEEDRNYRRSMFQLAFRDMRLNSAGSKDLATLVPFASEDLEERDQIERLIRDLRDSEIVERQESYVRHTEEEEAKCNKALEGIDVICVAELAEAIGNFRSMGPPFDSDIFWRETLKRVPKGRETEFLDAFIQVEGISYLTGVFVLGEVQRNWLGKAAVKRQWTRFLSKVGKRFALEFSDVYRSSYIREKCNFEDAELVALRLGIVDGLTANAEMNDAATFFGFVSSFAQELTQEEAEELLDYAIGRFEMHIPDDFGDGNFATWLETPTDVIPSVAGLIWSALGSPFSSERWASAHLIQRWALLGCEKEIEALIECASRRKVGAFGANDFPFYELHARLYLLISFARVAVDRPLMLVPHAEFFASEALNGLPHVLIQSNAKDIAIRIEEAAPGTIDDETVSRLKKVGVSPFPCRIVPSTGVINDSPWHANNQVDKSLKLSFEYEFDWYWFDQVGRIFGIPNGQVEEIAREIAVNHLGIESHEDYRPDPRQSQWNVGSYYDRGTDHSHSGYPRNDTHSFYFSYHSFLCAATKLFYSMPVLHHEFSDENAWADWVRRHSITRTDGRWLFDRRDPSPIRRREWVGQEKSDNWRWMNQADDFVTVITNEVSNPGFLCVRGIWSDVDRGRIESLRVTSALVTPRTAEALAASLRSASPHEFYLPAYNEEDDDFRSTPFEMTGWIGKVCIRDNGLDQFDLNANDIAYPPLIVGEEYSKKLGLVSDDEHRFWRRSANSEPSLVSEVWSERDISRHDLPYRYGERMCASVEILKDLCRATQKDIVFCVEIDRCLHKGYRNCSGDRSMFVPASHKVFLFSDDGILRDAQECHQVG
ncbi:MAG: ATP-binding protein [Verrucomicrobiota bacterium]